MDAATKAYMEKFGVDTSPAQNEKQAQDRDAARCPKCNSVLYPMVHVPMCPKCGTEPFEPKNP